MICLSVGNTAFKLLSVVGLCRFHVFSFFTTDHSRNKSLDSVGIDHFGDLVSSYQLQAGCGF